MSEWEERRENEEERRGRWVLKGGREKETIGEGKGREREDRREGRRGRREITRREGGREGG